MRDLIVKLWTLKESKDWTKIVEKLRELQSEKNKILLEGSEETEYYSEADMIRHEIKFINDLIASLKIKDKEVLKALVEDLEKSQNWRINRLLWKTHEYKLDNYVPDEAYTTEDFYRAENRWIECLENLPTKLINELELKVQQEEATKQAEVQEQIDALSKLEVEGL